MNTETLDQVVDRLSGVAEDIERLVELRVARAKVEWRERAFRGLGRVLLFALALGLTVASSVYLTRGIAGALRVLFHQMPWAGDLVAGLGALLLAAGIGLAMRARSRRQGLRRFRARFEPDEDVSEATP